MKTALIVAEFNPYHNGHKYIAKKARELTGADFVIALMSGDFVQRGAPAIVDRYTRAKMALSAGIDLVMRPAPRKNTQSMRSGSQIQSAALILSFLARNAVMLTD